MMKENISALMDGELFEDEADGVLNQVKRDSVAHRDWTTYHLIGDVLRQPEYVHRDISAVVREHMQNEPTVLAPRSRGVTQRVRNVALSAVASVMALGVVVWMSVQIKPETAPQMAMQQSELRPVSMKVQAKSNDYLLAHQELAPGNEMNANASNIRNVAYSAEDKAQ